MRIERHFLATIIFFVTLLSSCYNDHKGIDDMASIEKEIAISKKFSVSKENAIFFAEKISFDGKPKQKVSSIEPIKFQNETLMYLVNFENKNGWVVISGDRRTEPILAISETGEIQKDKLGASAVWYEDLADRIYSLKKSSNIDTISENYMMWANLDTLSNINKYGKSYLRSTNKEHRYEAYVDIPIDTKVKIVTDINIDHIIETKWGQSYPWNQFVPKEDGEHYPAGCVAVAGAQMLYFLHYKINKPSHFFDKFSIRYDYSNPSYSGASTEIWDKMAKRIYGEGQNYSAFLIRYVGDKVDIDYDKKGSGAYTKDLLKLYNQYGIDADYIDYDIEKIKKSLNKGFPVNIEASTNLIQLNLIFTKIDLVIKGGHLWIIDGYKEKRIDYEYTYDRVPAFQNSNDNEEYNYSGNYIIGVKPSYGRHTSTRTEHYCYWKMNFGWGEYDINYDGEYMAYSNDDHWNTTEGTFRYEKKIIYNFR